MDPGEPGFVAAWAARLDKLGIRLTEPAVDFALYQRRLDAFDFDLVSIAEGDFTLPDVAALNVLYGSKGADQPGSANYRGIKSTSVDRLLRANSTASSWKRFGRPAHGPRFFTLEEPNSAMIAWALAAWWSKPDAAR